MQPSSHPPNSYRRVPLDATPSQPCRGDLRTSEQSGKGTRDPPAPGPPPWLCTRLWAAAVVLSHPRCHPHVSPRVMLQAWVSGGGGAEQKGVEMCRGKIGAVEGGDQPPPSPMHCAACGRGCCARGQMAAARGLVAEQDVHACTHRSERKQRGLTKGGSMGMG